MASNDLSDKISLKDWNTKYSALVELIDSGSAESAQLLLKIAKEDEDFQFRGIAIKGFLKIHPAGILDDLAELAKSSVVANDEFPDMLRSWIILAIGSINGKKSIVVLKKLEKELKPVEASREMHFESSLEFSFLMAFSRLGQNDSAKKLVELLPKIEQRELVNALNEIGYCNNQIVAAGLAKFFDDKRIGSRIAPIRDYAEPPKTQEEKQKREEIEKAAHVSICDDALFAITQILKGIDWSFNPNPKRHYSDKEFALARKKIEAFGKKQ